MSESDLEEVSDGNYVYTPYYSFSKTRLNGGLYEEVEAIIVGTKDKELLKKVHFASIASLIKKHKD